MERRGVASWLSPPAYGWLPGCHLSRSPSCQQSPNKASVKISLQYLPRIFKNFNLIWNFALGRLVWAGDGGDDCRPRERT